MRWFTTLLLALYGIAGTARAYVDSSLSLGRIIGDASTICVLRVDKVSAERQAFLFKKVATLKGNELGDDVKQLIQHGLHPREPRLVLDLAEPGQTAVAFVNGRSMLVCFGSYWYECSLREGEWWEMTCGRPDLSMAFSGSARRLAEATEAILAGREVVVPAVQYNANDEYRQLTDFQNTLRGNRCPLCRVRASLKLDGMISELSRRPGYIVGPGALGWDELSTLMDKVGTTKNTHAWEEAVEELGKIDPSQHRKLMPLLWEYALNDGNPLVVVRAAAAYTRVVSAIPPEQKEAAAEGASNRPRMVFLLVGSLKKTEVEVRRAALEGIGDIGPTAARALDSYCAPALKAAGYPSPDAFGNPDVVTAVSACLRDADAGVRWRAAEALGRMGEAAAAAVPALRAALEDKSIRLAAADALGWIGGPAEPAVTELNGMTKDTDVETRRIAAWSLLRIGKNCKEAVPVLIEELRNTDWHIRRDAAAFLWNIGPEARPAINALTDALADVHPHVRWASAGAVVGLLGQEGKTALPVLLSALKDQDNVLTRRYAPAVLAQLGPEGRSALPALKAALRDPDADARRCAAIALAQFGAREQLPAVIEALTKSELAYVRTQAVTTLGLMGPTARDAMPALNAALHDTDATVRQGAAWALTQVKGRP